MTRREHTVQVTCLPGDTHRQAHSQLRSGLEFQLHLMVCFQPQKPAQTLSLNPRAGTTRTLSWLKIITTNILWVVQISLTASCILSDYAHAAGAYYEIIIACTAGAVTFLIENSRSLPYIPPERSQGRMTLQSCQCKTEREPVAQTTFQS